MSRAEIYDRIKAIDAELELCGKIDTRPWRAQSCKPGLDYVADPVGNLAGPFAADEAAFIIAARGGYPRALRNERDLLEAIRDGELVGDQEFDTEAEAEYREYEKRRLERRGHSGPVRRRLVRDDRTRGGPSLRAPRESPPVR